MVATPRKLRMAVITPLKPKTKPAATHVTASPPPKPGTTPSSVPGFKAAPGRPTSNVGKYLVKPTDADGTGHEMLNTTPDILKATHDRYLKSLELPPALQPKYLRMPEVMEVGRRKEISKGWVRPRSRM